MGNLLGAAPAARGCCWLHSTFNCCSCCCCGCGCNKRNAALLLQSEPGFCFKCFMAKRMQELPCNRYRDTLRSLATNCCTLTHTHTVAHSHTPPPCAGGDTDTHAFHFQLNCPLCFFFVSASPSRSFSLPLWQQQQQQKTKQNKAQSKNEVGKLHGPLHATPAAAMRLSHRVFYNHSARPPPALL